MGTPLRDRKRGESQNLDSWLRDICSTAVLQPRPLADRFFKIQFRIADRNVYKKPHMKATAGIRTHPMGRRGQLCQLGLQDRVQREHRRNLTSSSGPRFVGCTGAPPTLKY